MRFPNDTNFHLRMAAVLVIAMFVEHLASENLPNWSSPVIGVVPFVLGLVWVGMYAWHLVNMLQQRVRVLEDRIDRITQRTENLEGDRRERRSLPPM